MLGQSLTKAFAGGKPFGPKVKSSNLTPDTTGLKGWTAAQIVDTLKTGHNTNRARAEPPSARRCRRAPPPTAEWMLAI